MRFSSLPVNLVRNAVDTSGTVSKFQYNAHGDSDGFILDVKKQVTQL
jgi:hypothetical protein